MAESTFYTEWELSRTLFPRLRLRSSWDSRVCLPKDIMVPTELSVLGDADDSGFISDLDYSPSGRLLVACSSSNSLFVLDPNLGSVVKTFYKPHKDAISKVCFVGEYQFVSGSADSTIGYWDIRNPSKALNFLSGHTTPIRSLQYFNGNEHLISSCREGKVLFWHLPTFRVKKSSDNDDPLTQGTLLKCPNLNHCYFSESQGLAAIINQGGIMFILHNLNTNHLREDTANIMFDNTTYMQLCWFKPDSSYMKRNRVAIVDSAEYSPIESASVTSMAHLSIHAHWPIALMRITTSRTVHLSREVKDWTCICRLKVLDQPSTSNNDSLNEYMKNYGSNVIDGMLLYATEEKRYATFREKQPCLSTCGRVIASPNTDGVRLLKFSDTMDTCLSPIISKKPTCVDSLFQLTDWFPTHSSLTEVAHLQGPENSVLCCKFSPSDPTLLAVGDADGHISFYNPKL